LKYGRKPKLTASTLEEIEAALSIGATIGIACAYAGVSTSSYYNWQKWGKEALEKFLDNPDVELTKREEKYLRFYDAIEKAKAYAAIRWLEVVDAAAAVDASYALKMLRIRYPDGFSGRQSLEISGPEGSPVEVKASFERALERVYGDND